MAQQSPTGPKITPQNDLYTVLLIIAASMLFAGIIYLLVRSVLILDWPWAASGA
jgi:hypothetical protein